MEPVHNIVFFGETLPGYDRSIARMQLQALLGCSRETIHQVFSGQRVRLRKGLSSVEAQRYELRLKGIGLKVTIDPPLPPDMLDKHLSAVRDDAGRTVVDAPVPQVVCPACGETQPVRTICRACSINMPGYLAAQAAEGANAARQEQAGPPAAASEFFGLDFGGRFGRGLLLQTALLSLGILNLGFAAFFTWGSAAALAVAIALAALLKVRALVRRCHDLDWRGWVWLAQLVPVVGLYFTFKLACWPGRAEANAWGPRQRTSLKAIGLTAALFLGSLGWLAYALPDAPLPQPTDEAGPVLTGGPAGRIPPLAAG